MRKLKVIMVASVLLVGTVLSAATEPVKTINNPSSDEIGTLLENPEFIVKNEVSAYVTFMLNSEREIVVLSVKTENEEVEKFVKRRLNYQKVGATLEQGKEYKVPIRIVSES